MKALFLEWWREAEEYEILINVPQYTERKLKSRSQFVCVQSTKYFQ